MKRMIFLAAVMSIILTSCGSVSESETVNNGSSIEIKTTESQITSMSEPTDSESSAAVEDSNSESNGSATQAELTDPDHERISNATNVSEIKDLMHITSCHLKYSEVDTDELDYYFDLFRTVADKFIITEYEGKKYILFNYVYSGYGVKMDEVTNITKTYQGSTLDIHVDAVTHNYETIGCEPDMTYCRCILELDRDVDTITIDGNAEYSSYTRYDGGILYVGTDMCGVVDGDFNIIVPIKYEMIRKYDVYGYGSADLIAEYYYIFDENGGGLMDKDYNIIIDTSLKLINYCYINDDKFVVMDHNNAPLEESTIRLINSKGEDLREPINGFIDSGSNGNAFVSNYAHQAVFGRMQEGNKLMSEGVLDEDLNEVIPPVYKSVTPFFADTEYQFYVVEDENGKCAVAGTDGELKTGFDYNEIYDCWTDYDEKYIRPKEYKN